MWDQEQDKLVREVMRFMIFRQSEKPEVPVPRGELSKITSSHKKANGRFIIKLAQARFCKSMGLELKELKVASEKDIRRGQRGELNGMCSCYFISNHYSSIAS